MERDLDTLLVRWYNGDLSTEEIGVVAAWLQESPENRARAQEIYNKCFDAQVRSGQNRFDANAALQKVNFKLSARHSKKILATMRNIAASLLLPVILVSSFFFHRLSTQKASDPAMVEVSTVTGLISHMDLPDGSTVWLNANTTLRYPASFGKGSRDVELDGEAFFDIAHDSEHPFTVHTAEMDIRVTGTRFNVDAYGIPGRNPRTWLEEGGINLTWKDASGDMQSMPVKPGECALLALETRSVDISPAEVDSALAWKDGVFTFSDTPLEEALRQIGNRFNISFSLKNKALAGKRYTGTLKNESLETILDNFRLADGIRFKSLEQTDDNGRLVMEVY
jgi:ferric-dicitrate binding protein FerR (iron transport regulator)